MTGSNRRPTPCKGAALPTELITPPENQKSVQRILQCFARTKLGNLCRLDFNRSAGARIAARTCGTFSDRKCTKANQRNRAAFFQGRLHRTNGGLQRACSSSLGNIRVFCDVFYKFCFIHKDPFISKQSGRKSLSIVICAAISPGSGRAWEPDPPTPSMDYFCNGAEANSSSIFCLTPNVGTRFFAVRSRLRNCGTHRAWPGLSRLNWPGREFPAGPFSGNRPWTRRSIRQPPR